MIVILGIDPALNNVGYGLLTYDEAADNVVGVEYGMYPIDIKGECEDKLNSTFLTTQAIIKERDVTHVALEIAFHNPKMAKGGFAVREAIGALRVAVVQMERPLSCYTPQRIKRDITGNGAAKKTEVAQIIAELLGLTSYSVRKTIKKKPVLLSMTPEELIQKKYDHISDALAIAYCRLLEIKTALKEAI